jgi:hypothetical protein
MQPNDGAIRPDHSCQPGASEIKDVIAVQARTLTGWGQLSATLYTDLAFAPLEPGQRGWFPSRRDLGRLVLGRAADIQSCSERQDNSGRSGGDDCSKPRTPLWVGMAALDAL